MLYFRKKIYTNSKCLTRKLEAFVVFVEEERFFAVHELDEGSFF